MAGFSPLEEGCHNRYWTRLIIEGHAACISVCGFESRVLRSSPIVIPLQQFFQLGYISITLSTAYSPKRTLDNTSSFRVSKSFNI